MADQLNIQDFLHHSSTTPVLDVRTPGEYSLGHFPGSFNLPLLSDEERVEIGTLYKQKGKLEAVELGFELVGPKLVTLIREAKKIAERGELLLYCWRGGMRSNNTAWLLELNGIHCKVLEGGYKAYRQYGKRLFSSDEYLSYVIGGFTGSNKTLVLHALAEKGEQILDIEAFARHRGSSFGMIGQKAQLSNEKFENELIQKWLSFDPSKRIWIEDESKILGGNHIPDPLFERIRNSRVLKLEVDISERAKNLVEIYGHLDSAELGKAVKRIERKLGGQAMNEALIALEEEDYTKVASIALTYYDKTYGYGLSKRKPESVSYIKPKSKDPRLIAQQLLDLVEKNEKS